MSMLSKLFSLLDRGQKKSGALLLVMMLVAMVLEAASLGLIVPVLSVIADTKANIKYVWLEPVIALLDGNRTHFIIVTMVLLVLLYAVKTAFLALLAWQQAKYVFSVEASLSRRLYAGYLRQPYQFHIQLNSALLVRNITTGVGQLAGAIMSGASLVSECLVLVAVTALLLYVEPLGAVLVGGSMLVIGFGFYRLTRDRTFLWGENRQFHEGKRLQHLQFGLGGIREVKLLGRESQFVADYEVHNRGNAHAGQRQSFVTALPRLWLELLFVVSLTALVLTMIYQGRAVDAIMPILGLFTAAAFRIMPSLNKVLIALQNLRFNLPVINTLFAEREFLVDSVQQASSADPLVFKQSLQLKHVSYRYPGTQSWALTDVNVEIARGLTVGVIGPSGAGKSTLINLILGLFPPESGDILADGLNIKDHMRAWQRCVSYVPQNVFLIDDSLRRNIAFGIPNETIDEDALSRAVRAAQLTDFVASLPEGLNTQVGERGVRLSGGQCQRIGIARALYTDAPLLVLDEASSALDTATEENIMDTINSLRNNKTILIIAHRLSTLSGCDHLYKVTGGRVERVEADERLRLISSARADYA